MAYGLRYGGYSKSVLLKLYDIISKARGILFGCFQNAWCDDRLDVHSGHISFRRTKISFSNRTYIWSGTSSFNLSNPMVPGGGLYSSASDLLKFISSNIGLIKTKLDNAMQESHLIRHYTGHLIPNNIPCIR